MIFNVLSKIAHGNGEPASKKPILCRSEQCFRCPVVQRSTLSLNFASHNSPIGLSPKSSHHTQIPIPNTASIISAPHPPTHTLFNRNQTSPRTTPQIQIRAATASPFPNSSLKLWVGLMSEKKRRA